MAMDDNRSWHGPNFRIVPSYIFLRQIIAYKQVDSGPLWFYFLLSWGMGREEKEKESYF